MTVRRSYFIVLPLALLALVSWFGLLSTLDEAPLSVDHVANRYLLSNADTVIPPIYQDDVDYCYAHNLVPERGDHWADVSPEAQARSSSPMRPYSITEDTFASFHKCPVASLAELVHAVKFGKRHWRNPPQDEGLKVERPSYFVPDEYDIPMLTPAQSCSILGQFSHIVTIGDSLTRHLRGGMFMLLRKDFVSGGIVSEKLFTEANPYDNCRCDGQFSEHNMCRVNDGLFWDTTPREMSLCPHLTQGEQFRFLDVDRCRGKVPWAEAQCTDPNSRGVLLYLQGGVHYESNANKTLTKMIERHTVHNAGFRQCLEHNKVHVVWSTYTAQSRTLDEKYPAQSRENATKFNEEMAEYLAKLPFPVTVLDWWNLTADSQTSDGFHSLSDVNVVKAMHLLHAIHWTRHESKLVMSNLLTTN